MKVDVLLGLQWGDEGKGKVVDVLTPQYDIVARFQGGPNAGHTLEFEGQHFVLRSIPSGIFQQQQTNIIGSGVVLDPILFMKEVNELNQSGINLKNVLKISRKAHLILPTHRLLDAANERIKGDSKIGTTGKGIGPTYSDKISRTGIRVGDIAHNFKAKYELAKQRHIRILQALGQPLDTLPELETQFHEAIQLLQQFQLIDSEYYINEQLNAGKSLLCEGAQGSMLDIDFGSYPFVTSSNTICAGACTGLGIAPNKINNVYGIFKAYCTRVGAGPFPTELHDDIGRQLQQTGHEFGAVTGRPRRCGWLDLVALRYTIMLNGVTQLIMMKSDVLDQFNTIKICTAYRVNGKETNRFPFAIEQGVEVEPIYTELPGWQTPLTQITREEQFPTAFRHYIETIEQYLNVPIGIVSVGPDRAQTIIRNL